MNVLNKRIDNISTTPKPRLSSSTPVSLGKIK